MPGCEPHDAASSRGTTQGRTPSNGVSQGKSPQQPASRLSFRAICHALRAAASAATLPEKRKRYYYTTPPRFAALQRSQQPLCIRSFFFPAGCPSLFGTSNKNRYCAQRCAATEDPGKKNAKKTVGFQVHLATRNARVSNKARPSSALAARANTRGPLRERKRDCRAEVAGPTASRAYGCWLECGLLGTIRRL